MDKSLITEPKLFTVIRNHDQSGVSGVGRVLDGVLFPNGKVVICWRVEFQTVAIYESFEAFKTIHIDSHPTNQTEIVWNFNVNQIPTSTKRKPSFLEFSKFFGS